jgi:hypothetical protein
MARLYADSPAGRYTDAALGRARAVSARESAPATGAEYRIGFVRGLSHAARIRFSGCGAVDPSQHF